MEQLTGKIHSFESFGTVDGPGIRFVIFMQGCCLQCKYCHNRDTWDINSGNSYTVDEVLEKILKSKTYIQASGGGVTISGGEPLLQADFIISLFNSKSLISFIINIFSINSKSLINTFKFITVYIIVFRNKSCSWTYPFISF